VTQVTIGKWGNNLAVRLPSEIAQAAELHNGERVEIETRDGHVVIRRLEPRIVLEELFQGGTPDEWRAAYAGAYDWGPEIGQEILAD
jgi:antitoxin MazE